MDPSRYQRLKDLVDRALELPEIERDIFLQQNCEDAELLTEARDLLFHYSPDLGGATGGSGMPTDIPEKTDQKIGSYQIIKLLGEGGMGVVYLAAQSAPLRRKVALKVIKLGMDTREVISRFESERQALALMDHPNIAKVYDAGATDEGRPFFVMEYIPGVPLNIFCRDQNLGLRDRLNLFIQVCRGIQHAHNKGIIHRDLKPGNILVTDAEGIPVPKIIDFGVSKATSQHLAAQTLFTQMGQMIGTPEYMSPEQAGSSMEDVDTRSDVYSLGVLLYELLTGEVPLERRDIMRAGLERMALHVQNEIPKKPSTRIDTRKKTTTGAATEYGVDTRLWAKRVRGDLDWITMKALEKERDRRYVSPASLAEDLERHLNNHPVEAGPPSGLYRTRKFMKRNRPVVAMVSVALAALIGFAAWQTMQSQIISHERDKAVANERLSHARGHIAKDPTVAVAYALSSLEILDQPNARDVVREAIARAPMRNELPRRGQKGNPVGVDASPDGRYCVVTWSQSEHPKLGIYDLEDYSMQVLEAPGEGVAYEPLFNSDGSHVVANGYLGINIWRVADGQHLHHLDFVNEYASSCLFRLSDPNKMAVCANHQGGQTIWFEVDLHEGSVKELGRSIGAHKTQEVHIPDMNEVATKVLDFDDTRLYLQRFDDLEPDRATFVGEHGAAIASVAFDASCETGASVDMDGWIKVWDLVASPPKLIRKFKEDPGNYELEFDPFGHRFFSTFASGTARVYDLEETPKRNPHLLLDRTHWAHDGAFFPDGSVVMARNGIATGPVAHWKTNTPVAWSLDLSEESGRNPWPSLSADGKVLYLWSTDGGVTGVPLTGGKVGGVGFLGRTRGWHYGAYLNFLTDIERNRCLTWADGPQILDFTTGVAQDLPGVRGSLIPEIINQDGRLVGLSDILSREKFAVFDLDSLKIEAEIEFTGQNYSDVAFSEGQFILYLGSDHLSKIDFMNPSAPPDTLWKGDVSGGGRVFADGCYVLRRDCDMNVFWMDLSEGRETKLGRTSKGRMDGADFLPGLGLVALAGWWDTIDVFSVDSGEHWSLPVPPEDQKVTYSLSFDPLGRWLISVHPNQIMAWSLPIDPIFGEPEYDELLDSLRSLTNVRVVPDESIKNGFRITNTLDMELAEPTEENQ
ncbi:MAG: protein kinase [Candidatus Krumholzibacteria bacterium]|nr:protein kinase [Candidatus Krumholzibacteria bacterium]